MKPIPQELLHELQQVPGFDQEAFLAAHAHAAPTSVRVNPRKDIGVFRDHERVQWASRGIYLAERPIFTLDPAYHAGAYYVQEASSMFLEQALTKYFADRKGLRVLDLCAAPGGKSTHMASLLDEESLLVSNEVIRTRASILEENMTRWGYGNTWVISNDPRDIGRLEGYFDVVVVDAPCSGSGLWRKDERAIDEWSPANVQLCSERQQRILADVWPALKTGGMLVYATCSYSTAEDEQVLDWLASEFQVSPVNIALKNTWGIAAITSPASHIPGYRFFPHKVKGEGFFLAAVIKDEESNTPRPAKFKSTVDKKIVQQSAHLLQSPFIPVQTDKDNFSAIHPAHEADWYLLQKAVYLRKTGIALGQPSAKDWLPAHDVALSIDAATTLPSLSVNREQALRFLKREEPGIDDAPRGWLLVRYQGLGLGWVKSLGNRMNNYLPKHWRIRMDISSYDEE